MTRAGFYDFLIRHFVAITGVLGLLSYATIYAGKHAPEPIRSDGFSYYVYLPSWFLYGDPTLDAIPRTFPSREYADFTGATKSIFVTAQ